MFIFLINILVFMQFAWEFNRVMGKYVATSITEKLIKMLPEMITTAEEKSEEFFVYSFKEESGID